MERSPRTSELFKLVEHLGTGGFAHTWRAQVLQLNLIEEYGTKEVALKIPLDRGREKILIKELIQNAALHQTLQEMEATNLTRYLGFEEFDGKYVMVMEYVRGGNLRARLGEPGFGVSLTLEESVAITAGVLTGLAVIHKRHIVHRDIKPENIVMAGNIPKITDLGISKMVRSDQLMPTQVGTLPYMAPEVLRGPGGSTQVDVWGVGVMLYEMLTGELPFGSFRTPPRDLIDLICRASCRPATELNPDLPPTIDKVFSRALTKSPQQRYGAEEMRRDLEALAGCPAPPSAPDEDLAQTRVLLLDPEGTRKAEKELRQWLKQYPEDARIYQYLAELYNRQARHQEAIRILEEGIRCCPAAGILHWYKGLAHESLKQHRAALAAIEQAQVLGLEPHLDRYAERLVMSLRKRTAKW